MWAQIFADKMLINAQLKIEIQEKGENPDSINAFYSKKFML